MDVEELLFETAVDFEKWLEVNADTSGTVGLRLSKKGSGHTTVSYAQAVEVALCFGWIDGQKRKLDQEFWVQYFSKRKSRSIWSQINREKAMKLVAEGRMRHSGVAAIEAAQANGQWQAAYQPTRSREIPEELAEALAKSPKAQEFFDSLDSANRFAFVFRSVTAKKEETRQKWIASFIAMMEKGETLHPR